MEITVNGKKHQLVFGVGFVRNLDTHYGMANKAGLGLGMAFGKVIPGMKIYDTAILSEVIQAAAEPSISLNETDQYIDNCKDVEKLFKDVWEEMSKANAVKLAVKKVQ
jgi:hypothetical protein